MTRKFAIRVVTIVLCAVMLVGLFPVSAFATIENWASTNVVYDGKTFGTNGYYNVISKKDYVLVPGAAVESEIVLNNAAGNRRQVIHVIEVDPTNPDVSIVPGYYQIDKDLTDEANWSHKELTEMAKYYEDTLGYNIVGGMNTDLYYDTYAPRILVYNGKDLSVKGKTTPSSSILYVFKDAEGNISCDVKAFNRTEFNKYLEDGTLLHAVSVSFGMVVKNGELVSKKEERTSSAAARSMVGIKEDGTLVICMNDGRGANNSVGFCDYEEGEAMLALGCKWAANCDGGGSSTFVTKRVGEDEITMRSVPCDGAQRPTAHGIFVASNVAPTGILDVVNVTSDYDIFAPKTVYTFGADAIDTHGYAMDMPADATWTLSDANYGTIADGRFVSNGTKGEVVVQIVSGGQIVGSKTITIADPETFKLSATSTVVPYSTADRVRTITLPIVAMTGEANVYVDTNAVTVTLSDNNAGILDGFKFTSTSDTSVAGVNVTVNYGTITLVYAIEFGKGSEIIYDFEDGDRAGFVGFEEAKKWSQENDVNNTLVGADPLAGQFNEFLSSTTFVTSAANGGQVRNGNYALAWRLDNSDAAFASWSYNVLFNVGETIVLRDVANDMKATALGMWLYVPENAFPAAGKGLSFQSQFYTKDENGNYTCGVQKHFMFTSAATGQSTNLNSASNADIPESRWVYVTIDISDYDFVCTPVADCTSNTRTPSFLRTYVKPDTADEITFYIDDITLDYSSAVDDRILPTITDPAYSTSDTAVTLENDAVINGNKIAFSATVADNAALDLTSGKIFVDGVEVKASVAGNNLASAEDVMLVAGSHVVSFEIKDELGNPAKLTRTFTVSGDAVVTLTGHNDSGEAPKAQSIYYVDINVDDLTNVTKLIANLKLHNANTWETEGAVVANGFKATFSYNEVSELLTVTVELEDASKVSSFKKTLVSIPVRVWTFDRYNYVTNTAYDPASMGNKPVVDIDCKIVYGEITLADNTVSPFGGSINVKTELTTISSPYHIHDANLSVLNKNPSIFEEGYANRTYCETCQSVIEWGTSIEKLDHNYALVGNRFVCSDDGCGHVYESGTGIFEMNDKLYYSVNDELKTGWQDAETGYCYAASGTYALVIGEKTVNGVKYVFDENGVTNGAWVVDENGTRYSYGPMFYRRTWVTIDGSDYYFGRDSYMYVGVNYIKSNPDTPPVWYEFGADGKADKNVPFAHRGLYEYNDELYYIGENGVGQFGLQLVNGDYYYFQSGEGFEHVGYAAIDKNVYVKTTNDLTFPDGSLVPQKTFYFDAEGKMLVLNGIIDGVYYENGRAISYKGLVEQDGYFYYVSDAGKIMVNKTVYVKTTNGLLFADGNPVLNRNYNFDEEGKMIILNGIIDGVYYENSQPVSYKGLVEQDGDFYYVSYAGQIMVDKNVYVKTTNDLLFADGNPVLNRTYTFDAEGKMVIINGLIDGVYYENSQPVSYKGLIEHNGDFYYVSYGGQIMVNKNVYVKTTNDLLFADGTPVLNRTYTFDAEGKMVIFSGIIDGVYYENSQPVSYKGLVEQDGDFYYIAYAGEVMVNKNVYVKTTNGLTFADGTPVLNRTYTFDAEGKMVIINGLIDGVYYENSQPVSYKGLIEQDGDFYYVSAAGEIIVGTSAYVKTTNGLTFADGSAIPNKVFAFDAEGKMIY